MQVIPTENNKCVHINQQDFKYQWFLKMFVP